MNLVQGFMDWSGVLWGSRPSNRAEIEAIDVVRGNLRAVSPSELPATAVFLPPIADLTTTRQRILIPSGAKWVHLAYMLLPAATATANQYAKVCFNAVSISDADGKLAIPGAYFMLFQGQPEVFSFADDNLCTVIDVVAAQAVGSEKTMLRAVAGV